MGILDDTKKLGKDAVKLGVKVGKEGVKLGKKGVDTTKETLRTKRCSECRDYTPIDDVKGNCPIASERLAVADVSSCPQKAYVPRT